MKSFDKKMIIGFCGPSSSGKDTAAKMLQNHLTEVSTISFAAPLKEFAQYVFEFPVENLWGSSSLRNEIFPEFANPERWTRARKLKDDGYARTWAKTVLITYYGSGEHEALSDALDLWFQDLEKESLGVGLSPRRMLQTLGTECGRTVSPDIWANYGIHRAKSLLNSSHARVVAITDVRFVNESKIIRASDGEVWFLSRTSGLQGQASQHKSETELLSDEMRATFSRTIDNTGSLEHLDNLIQKAVRDIFGAPIGEEE